ncbi:uncharacterized protein LOC124200966 [Daphnia pulex]|uniref:uncharacterized protein LOC124200966 n=1 Tax=Daphnia pulex TaxID=6669 RepID=UPI001EE043C5|nr:uncharacterized protein LOC124200966 [Daphnia pulex]
MKFSTSTAIILLVGLVCHPAPINSASLNVTSDNNDDSLVWLALFGNPNVQDPDQLPCPDGQPCVEKSFPSAEGGESLLADTSFIKFTAEEGFILDTSDSSVLDKQRVTYVFTERTKEDDKRAVCRRVLRDVRGTCSRGLCKAGTNVIALLTQTSFGRNENGKTLKSQGQARVDLQGMFTKYGKRWANLQVQWNGVHPSPTSFGNAFIQAETTFPIRLIRSALVRSVQKCIKVWLEVAPKKVPNDP